MVAGLRNVDDDLAQAVADGLGLAELPEARSAARPTITGLQSSSALSILENGPASFAGRKLGVLITEGADRSVLDSLTSAAKAAAVNVELIAPTVGGVTLSDGALITADQKIEGGPSVLYDAVALLTSEDGALALAGQPAARDFVTDAYAHCKFIGYDSTARALLAATGMAEMMDDGCFDLGRISPADFLEACGNLRHWARKLSAAGERLGGSDT
jgi:catalase